MDSRTPISTECRHSVGNADSPAFAQAQFDDSSWPVGTRVQGELGPGNAVWFRCHVKVPESVSQNGLVLDLGRIADQDRTFVNGQEVGNTHMLSPREWSFFLHRNYFVSQAQVQNGEAVVAVRAESRSFGMVGFIDHPPEFHTTWDQTKPSVYEFLPFAFILIFMGLARLYPFNKDLSRQRFRALTQMGVGIASVVLMNSFLLYRTFFTGANIWLRLHVIVTSIAALLLFRFLDLVLQKRHSRWLPLWTAAICLGALALPGYEVESASTAWTGKLFGLWGIPILAYGLVMIGRVTQRFVRERSPAFLSLLLGGVALIALGGWDVVELLMGNLPVSLPLSAIGFVCFFIGAIFNTIAADREGAMETVRSEYAAHVAVASLASQVAHDIRSPLAALELVVSDLESLPEEKRILVREAAQRIKDIANGLLTRNRDLNPSLGGSELPTADEPARIELLSGVVEQIVSEKRVQYRVREGLKIESEVGQSAYGLFASIQPGELKRVLSNLINNAVESIDRTGKVAIRLVERGSVIQVSIEDNGKGIPEDVLVKLGQRGNSHDKASGSGLGLFHARTSARNWGGSLEIRSKLGQGTTVTLTLPKAEPPSWFVRALEFSDDQTVVILDDDQSIHKIWERRLAFGPKLVHLTTGEQLEKWLAEFRDLQPPSLYLVDFELKGEARSGLDWIEALGIQEQSILVSSRCEDPAVRERCVRQGIRMIPKGIAGFVPVRTRDQLELGLSRPACVLIDDDFLVHLIWKSAADSAGAEFLVFSSPEEFELEMDHLDRDTPIYIDSDLGDGQRGEEIARRYYDGGFRNLYLATGSAPREFGEMPWFKAIVGKNPPVELKSAAASAAAAPSVAAPPVPGLHGPAGEHHRQLNGQYPQA